MYTNKRTQGRGLWRLSPLGSVKSMVSRGFSTSSTHNITSIFYFVIPFPQFYGTHCINKIDFYIDLLTMRFLYRKNMVYLCSILRWWILGACCLGSTIYTDISSALNSYSSSCFVNMEHWFCIHGTLVCIHGTLVL